MVHCCRKIRQIEQIFVELSFCFPDFVELRYKILMQKNGEMVYEAFNEKICFFFKKMTNLEWLNIKNAFIENKNVDSKAHCFGELPVEFFQSISIKLHFKEFPLLGKIRFAFCNDH